MAPPVRPPTIVAVTEWSAFSVAAHHHHVAHFEVGNFRGLTVFAKFRLWREFNGDGLTVRIRDFNRAVMHSGDFAEERPAAFLAAMHPAFALLGRRSGRLVLGASGGDAQHSE